MEQHRTNAILTQLYTIKLVISKHNLPLKCISKIMTVSKPVEPRTKNDSIIQQRLSILAI